MCMFLTSRYSARNRWQEKKHAATLSELRLRVPRLWASSRPVRGCTLSSESTAALPQRCLERGVPTPFHRGRPGKALHPQARGGEEVRVDARPGRGSRQAGLDHRLQARRRRRAPDQRGGAGGEAGGDQEVAESIFELEGAEQPEGAEGGGEGAVTLLGAQAEGC